MSAERWPKLTPRIVAECWTCAPWRGKGNDMRTHYETDDQTFSADAYTAHGWRGIAWRVLGWETAPTEDTKWDGIEERTGRVVARMVGDDRDFTFDPEELTAIPDEAYCAECGQIGCTADGRDRG